MLSIKWRPIYFCSNVYIVQIDRLNYNSIGQDLQVEYHIGQKDLRPHLEKSKLLKKIDFRKWTESPVDPKYRLKCSPILDLCNIKKIIPIRWGIDEIWFFKQWPVFDTFRPPSGQVSLVFSKIFGFSKITRRTESIHTKLGVVALNHFSFVELCNQQPIRPNFFFGLNIFHLFSTHFSSFHNSS